MNENFKMDYLDEEDELYHHGILGMKWGVRRTPEQLGHRTGEGRKGKGAKDSGRKGLFGRRKKSGGSDEVTKPKKKSISEMSDEELKAHINRLTATKNAMNLEREIAAMQPKNMKQKLIEQAASEIPKQLANFGQKKLGELIDKAFKEPESEYSKLKKVYDLEKLKKDMADLNKTDPLEALKIAEERSRLRSNIRKNNERDPLEGLRRRRDAAQYESDIAKSRRDRAKYAREFRNNSDPINRRYDDMTRLNNYYSAWRTYRDNRDEYRAEAYARNMAQNMRSTTVSQAASSAAASAGRDMVQQLLLTGATRLLLTGPVEEDD